MSTVTVRNDSYDSIYVEYLKPHDVVHQTKSKLNNHNYEIYYYLGDNINYSDDSKNFMLEKNNLLLIDKSISNKITYSGNSDYERVLIEFTDEIFNLISDKETVKKIIGLFDKHNKIELSNNYQQANIHSLIFKIVSNYYSQSKYGNLFAKFNLAELCLHLVEYSENIKTIYSSELELSPKKKSESNIDEIINYINDNYSSKITLDNLVEMFYVNKYYLCHIFKNETGISIINFVNAKRLSEAEKLLKFSDLSITEICYKIGFNSINHFLKLFKSAYSATPKKYRDSFRLNAIIK